MNAEKLDAVIAELQRGCSYHTAAKRAGVSVKALRDLRYGDPAIMRRCERARAAGMLHWAEVREQRARKMLATAAALRAKAERITGVLTDYEV